MKKNYHSLCSSVNKNFHQMSVSLYGISSAVSSDFGNNAFAFKNFTLFKNFDYYRLSDLEGLELSDFGNKSISEFGRKWLDY